MQRLHNVTSAAQYRDSSPDTTTVKTLNPPKVSDAGGPANACLLTVETTNARVTFDGSTPSATNGHVLVTAQNPLYLPFASAIKWISTAGTASIINVTWLSN